MSHRDKHPYDFLIYKVTIPREFRIDNFTKRVCVMELLNYLPVDFRRQIVPEDLNGAEEIRLRVGRPLEILYADEKSRAYGVLEEKQLREMLNYLSGYSPYAMEEELRQGFFTVEGGHRIGVSGRTSFQKKGRWNEMNPLSEVNGLNIRIAHERKGCAMPLLPWLYNGRSIYHTIIFAAPGVGKTTYLRDTVRCLSTGNPMWQGLKVGVVDERSEIAACHWGVPQNDLGLRCDVLDNCPKEQGMRMLLRSMSPEVIAVDELGLPEDFEAFAESAKCGVAVLATVHAGKMEEVLQRMEQNGLKDIFPKLRLAGLRRQEDGSRKMRIYDGEGNCLWQG